MDSIADSRGGMGTSALAAAITAILSTSAPLASADVVPGTQSDVHFESSQLVGSGRDINALRLPVVDVKSGRVDYYDTRFRLSLVDGAFVMTIIGASKSPAVLGFDNITPGVYQDSNGACYALGGPTLLPDGRRLYTIDATTEPAGCYQGTSTFRAQFVSGAAVGHPDIGGREIARSLKSTWLYGYIATGANWTRGGVTTDWEDNELLGVRQSSRQLVLGDFTDSDQDFADPKDTAILTRIGD